MKSNLYIKHDLYASNDKEIRKLLKEYQEAGYGVWWAIVEVLTQDDYHALERDDLIENVQRALFAKKSTLISKVVDSCLNLQLLQEENGYIYNERVVRQCEEADEKSRKNAENARLRWAQKNAEKEAKAVQTQCERTANAMPVQCDGNAIEIEMEINNQDRNKNQDGDGNQQPAQTPTDFVVAVYKELCEGKFNALKTLSDTRKGHCNALCQKFSKEDIREGFSKASISPFLNGANPNGWKATFDWLILPNNFTKVLEGNYDEKTPVKQMPKTSVCKAEDFSGINEDGSFDL